MKRGQPMNTRRDFIGQLIATTGWLAFGSVEAAPLVRAVRRVEKPPSEVRHLTARNNFGRPVWERVRVWFPNDTDHKCVLAKIGDAEFTRGPLELGDIQPGESVGILVGRFDDDPFCSAHTDETYLTIHGSLSEPTAIGDDKIRRCFTEDRK